MTEEELAELLDEMVRDGLIKKAGDAYTLTAAGLHAAAKIVREDCLDNHYNPSLDCNAECERAANLLGGTNVN